MQAYAELGGPNGSTNMGGTAQYILVVPVSDVATFGALEAAPANIGELAEITENHVLAASKKFTKIYCEYDSGELQSKMQGDRGGRSIKNELAFFTPGATKENIGTLNQAMNDRFLALVPTATTHLDGKYVQIGIKEFPAEMMGDFTTGKNSSGARGVNWKIESGAPGVILYSGTVDLTV
jgi:hypothetical protein